jgi:hypothetical protein
VHQSRRRSFVNEAVVIRVGVTAEIETVLVLGFRKPRMST